MKKKKLKGNPPDIIEMNLAMYGVMDPDIDDVSLDNIGTNRRLFQNKKPKGVIVIYSTAGNMTDQRGRNFKMMWDE